IHVPASFESSLNLPKGSSKTVLHFHHVGGFIVFDLDGPLAMPWVADELLAVVQQMLDNGTKNLVIDLADVPYADSAGVGALMAARTLIEGTGGNLVLVQAARPI